MSNGLLLTLRWMRRLVPTWGVVLASLLATAGAAAAGTLDQSSVAPNQRSDYLGGPAWVVGQTFTAGATGRLDQVDVYLNRAVDAPDGPVTVEIQTSAGNLPSGVAIAAATIPGSSIPYTLFNNGFWITVALASPPVVVAGTQYALVLSSSATTAAFQTWVDPTGGYAGGQLSHRATSGGAFSVVPSADLNFRTYVQPLVGAAARGGYCATTPVRRTDGSVGVFLDLLDGQPMTDPAFSGAIRASFGQGYGLTCDALPGLGYRDAGYRVDGGGNRTGSSSDVYPYFVKP